MLIGFFVAINRKLQRTNEELQEQVDGLQIQATHLQTRLPFFLLISLSNIFKHVPLFQVTKQQQW